MERQKINLSNEDKDEEEKHGVKRGEGKEEGVKE